MILGHGVGISQEELVLAEDNVRRGEGDLDVGVSLLNEFLGLRRSVTCRLPSFAKTSEATRERPVRGDDSPSPGSGAGLSWLLRPLR